MDNTLKAVGNSGSLSQTQDPQSATSTNGAIAQANSIQPEPTADALTSSEGLNLHPTALSTVNLSGRTTTSASTITPAVKHHTNPILLGFSGLLIIVAILLVWAISRPAKETLN